MLAPYPASEWLITSLMPFPLCHPFSYGSQMLVESSSSALLSLEVLLFETNIEPQVDKELKESSNPTYEGTLQSNSS